MIVRCETASSDATPPTGSLGINSGAACTNTTAVTLNLSADDAVGVTRYRVANGTDASGGTIVAVPSTTSFSANIGWTLPAGDGVKTVAVQYGDAAGNWSQNYTDSIILDTTPPVVTITAPVNGVCYQNAPTRVYTVVEANPYTVVETGWSNAEGTHTYTVTATDCAGNVGSASVTYTVDRTPPVVTITSPTTGWTNNPVLSYVVTEANPYNVGVTGWFTVEGTHTVTVTATDCAGNTGSDSVTYSVDTTPPTVTITTPPNGACYPIGAVVYASFSCSDALSGIASCVGTVPNGASIDTATAGGKTFAVTARDNAGNSTTVTHGYSVVLPKFQGINPPYGSRPTIKQGSTFPIKWGYTVCGQLAASPGANPSIRIQAPNGQWLVPIEDAGKSGGPRYDPIAMQWIYNWQTKGLAPGTYRIYIDGTGIWPTNQGPFDVELRP